MKIKKFIINVTQRDIDKGCRGDSFCCPVARAINRKIKTFVSVHYSIVFRHSLTIAAPKSVQTFINKYDTFGPKAVAPFKFQIEVPVNE